ncbi:Alpha/Beta hydrolase protein [Dactylonectria estremocensis]|uniref:Alpha/Beta hydrolase protein n=1 Tax=Dactylonectria estremocensis TaxID=1079267 RepID=A0A9P9EMV3_9HYPO|nr:Alpha/Beta hydrolase protein [Dactylonectria estremocensis]
MPPTDYSYRTIRAWLYFPNNNVNSGTVDKRPLLINWHGSGFTIPSFDDDIAFCSRVARDVGTWVLDADYRKGPETPFPGAVFDVEDTLKWVASQPQFDLARIAVSGFSAGANLGLVAASSLRENLAPIQIPLVIAMYPVTDLSMDPYTKTVPNPYKAIPPRILQVFNDCYIPDLGCRTDPRVSPSFADPKSFPSTVVIITCERDTLAPEANTLASKLVDNERKVVHEVLKGVSHAFDKGCKEGTTEWEQREYLYHLCTQNLKKALSL